MRIPAAGMVGLALLCLASPSSQAVPPDNWGDFLFLFTYGEIDPFDTPWRDVRSPVFMDTLHRMGVNLSVPVTISTDVGWGLRHDWTRHWLEYPNTVLTPWWLWVDDVYGKRYPEPSPYGPWGCYNNPLLKPHELEVLRQVRDTYAERCLRVQGRPVLNFEKEHPFSSAQHLNRHYCEHDRAAFRKWLQEWYGDATPATDSNRDGKTMNRQCGTRYRTWAEALPDEAEFRRLTEERYQYPFLQFLWLRWLEDNAWRDFYLDLADRLGIWQFCTETMPSRFLEKQPFLYHYAFTLTQLYTGDYWTRRDPNKLAVSYFCGLYLTDANTDPYLYDRFLARICGQISRWRAIYQIDFDPYGKLEFADYQVSPREHPGCLEAHSWWAHTMGAQKWLFDGLLTHRPEVALYRGEESFPALNDVQNLYVSLTKLGYPLHYLDRDLIIGGALQDYRVLIVNGERIPWEVMAKIVEFRRAGGYVLSNYSALTWSLTQPENETFEKLFGARFSRAVQGTNLTREIDPKSPFSAKAEQVKGILVCERTDPESPLWQGVKAYWEDGILREDAAVLVQPTAAKALGNLREIGKPEEACVTLSDDGRALFNGLHQGSYTTTRAQLTANFLEHAGVHRAVDCDNPQVEAYRLESDPPQRGIQVVVLINNDLAQPQAVQVNLGRLPAGTGCLELRTLAELALEEGRLTLALPPGQVRILLLAPPAIRDRAREVQERVNREARVFPWHCSRHFFLRRPVPAGEIPYRALMKPARELPAEPNCAIVLPETPTERDRWFAEKVQEVIRDWPMAAEPVVIPIKLAADLTPEEAAQNNLLLIGSPEENSWTQREFERVGLAPLPHQGIVSHHEKGWYTGDSFVAVVAPPQQRERAYVEFLDWMRVWLDHKEGYVPERTW